MVPLHHLKDRTIGVFGLARSGLATIAAARAGGARAIAFDDNAEQCEKANALGAEIAVPDDWPWGEIAILILAPGVPLTHPEPHAIVALAEQSGTEIICDIELLYREVSDDAVFVAITGTNGKSTTTALIGHILTNAGRHAQVGGNIGTSALDLEPPSGEGSIYVLEMSSYQLDLTDRFAPQLAFFLNLTPDHLDRHGDMAGYRKAKARIYANQGPGDTLVIGLDEPELDWVRDDVLAMAEPPELITLSVEGRTDVSAHVDDDGQLHSPGQGTPIDLTGFATLRGRHNWQNAAAAFLGCETLGLSKDEILSGLTSFAGLAHRLEILGRIGKVLFVNDSKATNADATARALDTFRPVYWIAGGLCTEGGIEHLTPQFTNIAKAYLIGDAADTFSQTLAGEVPHTISGDLAQAVHDAIQDAALDPSPEPTILLSPAAKSFDQFANFEIRGEAFRTLFETLDAKGLAGLSDQDRWSDASETSMEVSS